MSRQYKPKAGFWIRLCVLILYPFDALAYRTRWRHLERMPSPDDTGVIIALNHVSHIDTVLMAKFVWQSGRIPRFMIKAGVFDIFFIGSVFRGAKQIPVYRGTADAANSLRDAVTALERKEAIVIYPEGTITKTADQWPMQAKTGIARLWLLAPDTPVIPCGQWGAQQTKRISPLRPFRRRSCEVSVGEPVDLERFRGAEPTAATLREITDTIMRAVQDQVADLRGETPPAQFQPAPKKYVDGNGG